MIQYIVNHDASCSSTNSTLLRAPISVSVAVFQWHVLSPVRHQATSGVRNQTPQRRQHRHRPDQAAHVQPQRSLPKPRTFRLRPPRGRQVASNNTCIRRPQQRKLAKFFQRLHGNCITKTLLLQSVIALVKPADVRLLIKLYLPRLYQSLKIRRLFLLSSHLDNPHSTGFNVFIVVFAMQCLFLYVFTCTVHCS